MEMAKRAKRSGNGATSNNSKNDNNKKKNKNQNKNKNKHNHNTHVKNCFFDVQLQRHGMEQSEPIDRRSSTEFK